MCTYKKLFSEKNMKTQDTGCAHTHSSQMWCYLLRIYTVTPLRKSHNNTKDVPSLCFRDACAPLVLHLRMSIHLSGKGACAWPRGGRRESAHTVAHLATQRDATKDCNLQPAAPPLHPPPQLARSITPNGCLRSSAHNCPILHTQSSIPNPPLGRLAFLIPCRFLCLPLHSP